MMGKGRRRLLAGIITLLAAPAGADILQMGYPLEYYTEQGPGHFASDFLRVSEAVIAQSGVKVEWQAVPTARLYYMLEHSRLPYCVGAAGILPERQNIGRFTIPFGYDTWLAVVARKDKGDLLADAHSFAELAERSDDRFLIYGPMNYGENFSKVLTGLGSRVSRDFPSVEQLFDMVVSKRAGFVVVPKLYAQNFLASRSDEAEFIVVSYPDMRRDYKVGFWCNKETAETDIDALNATITRLKPWIGEHFPQLAKP